MARIILHSIAYVSSLIIGVEFDTDYRAVGENKIVAMAGIFY